MKVDVPVQVLVHVVAYIIPNRENGHWRGKAGVLNAVYALLGFRRLSRSSLRPLGVLCRSRFLGLRRGNRALRERDRELGSKVRGRKPGELIHTSPSAESSTAFFFVDFLAVVVAVDLIWRVELRVERVDVVAGSVSSSSPRFLLDNIKRGRY